MIIRLRRGVKKKVKKERKGLKGRRGAKTKGNGNKKNAINLRKPMAFYSTTNVRSQVLRSSWPLLSTGKSAKE